MKRALAILKFGSSVLRSPEELRDAVQEIYGALRAGEQVVAVVSALGETTDRLLAQARALVREPAAEHLAALLATGERASVEWLALALQDAGLPAHALQPEQLGLRVEGPPLDARAVALDVASLRARLAERDVLVVPGFVGLDACGRVALLGRGGSDLSALFLARELEATRCVLLKDVDGLYERDPATPGPRPRRFDALSFDSALALGGGVVQPKALEFAREHGLRLWVAACARSGGTCVGAHDGALRDAPPARVLRVGLVGLGVVGGRVRRELERCRERFELVGCVSRRAPARWDPLWTSSVDELLARRPDVLVELTGAAEAGEWIEGALRGGCHVVTAHKRLLAARGPQLELVAARSGAELLGSAAVGGAVPMLERARALAAQGALVELAGVLNGTCNFVLEQLERGRSLPQALDEARGQGLAEADARCDLSGDDAAAKLALLARAAFGLELRLDEVQRTPLDEALLPQVAAALARGRRLRAVARCERVGDRLAARVGFEALELVDPLLLAGAGNALVLRAADGRCERLRGVGAGAGPTSTAVLADLLELWRTCAVREAAPSRLEVSA